ncbi:cytochrome P450-10 [Coleophoma crateriformis]|uniref:Cytochrome P450-10 n=1 Tax=Coleophoma crateriformis TaxID=565419 RepID=A0A3D8QY24_9HELO|nr:cytochrome P450-10 [Coleophoma crateriformis]
MFVLILQAAGTVVALLLLQAVAKGIYNVFLHPLHKYPGPKSFAATSLPWAITTAKGQWAYCIRSLHDRYGHVVRTGPNELVYCDAASMKDILTRRPPMTKSAAYYNVPPLGTHSILTVKVEADHARYRRVLAHAFSEKALREQEPLIQKYIDLFIARLHQCAADGTPQDLVAWFNYVSFDIIGDLTLGQSFNCLESNTLHPWVQYLFQNFKAATLMGCARRFPSIFGVLMKMMPQKAIQDRMEHFLFSKRKVEERMQSQSDRKDFMTFVLRHNEKDTGMSIEEIVPTFALLLLAGSETTATLLSVTSYYLLQNPEVMDKLVKEIRGTFKTEEDINMVSVNSLQYEIAVLDEALRIHPPTPLGSPRVVPDGGEMVGGEWVPGGTTLYASTYSMNRSEKNWTDPDKFAPERWLKDPKYANDDKAAFAPFSLGTRNCIGKNLAIAEMRVILARLLWNFDLELTEQSRGWVQNMKMFILWEKPPLLVKLKAVVR